MVAGVESAALWPLVMLLSKPTSVLPWGSNLSLPASLWLGVSPFNHVSPCWLLHRFHLLGVRPSVTIINYLKELSEQIGFQDDCSTGVRVIILSRLSVCISECIHACSFEQWSFPLLLRTLVLFLSLPPSLSLSFSPHSHTHTGRLSW